MTASRAARSQVLNRVLIELGPIEEESEDSPRLDRGSPCRLSRRTGFLCLGMAPLKAPIARRAGRARKLSCRFGRKGEALAAAGQLRRRVTLNLVGSRLLADMRYTRRSGSFMADNISPDHKTGIGAWSLEAFTLHAERRCSRWFHLCPRSPSTRLPS